MPNKDTRSASILRSQVKFDYSSKQQVHSQIKQGMGLQIQDEQADYEQENNNNIQACLEVHPWFRQRFQARAKWTYKQSKLQFREKKLN